jgi:enamine deaminase RidA (YjgF/YER057c/UK114 family)
VSDIKRIEPGPRMSKAVINNGTVYLQGLTPNDKSQDAKGQVEQVLARIDAGLKEAGSDRSRILSAMIMLKDIKRDFPALNAAWEAWIPKGQTPARATWQADLAQPDILVEIVVIAALK